VCVATSTASADRVDVDVEGVECMMITVMVMAMWADPSHLQGSSGVKDNTGSHKSGIHPSSSSAPPPLPSFPSDPHPVYSPRHRNTHFTLLCDRLSARLCSALAVWVVGVTTSA
jgi:hypothetical protein